MSQHGEAAEQVVNMATNAAVKTAECAAEIVGKGTLSLATFLLAVLKDQKKTKGRTRIQSFNGRPTKVFAIMAKDMKTFSKEAKEYGILYAAVMNRKSTDGIVGCGCKRKRCGTGKPNSRTVCAVYDRNTESS